MVCGEGEECSLRKGGGRETRLSALLTQGGETTEGYQEPQLQSRDGRQGGQNRETKGSGSRFRKYPGRVFQNGKKMSANPEEVTKLSKTAYISARKARKSFPWGSLRGARRAQGPLFVPEKKSKKVAQSTRS